ncbi:uncharacterized protein LOC143915337 [Arctopsyche grandis]|uniref:uncharacterized protein LOC143915337 n=1 Tax=Arctopsyche grandis TaxID=121162 RepID=UPI00406D8C68
MPEYSLTSLQQLHRGTGHISSLIPAMAFDTDKFIMEIQNRPAIWDSTDPVYMDRYKKSASWEEIVEIFGGAELDTEQKKQQGLLLLTKWRGLRSSYSRESRRQKKIMSGSVDRRSEYVYFKPLQFLQKVSSIRDTSEQNEIEDNGYIEGVKTSENQLASEPAQDKPIERKSYKKKRKPVNESDPFVVTLQKSIDTRERQQKEESDEDRMFLLSLLKTLKTVPQERKMSTKIKIMSILNEATQNYNAYSSSPRHHVENYEYSNKRVKSQEASPPILKRLSSSYDCQYSQPPLPPNDPLRTPVASPATSYMSNNSDSMVDLYNN